MTELGKTVSNNNHSTETTCFCIQSTSLYRLTNQGKQKQMKGSLTPEGLIMGIGHATYMDELNYNAWMSGTTMMNSKLQLSD